MKILMDTLLPSDSPHRKTALQEGLIMGMDEEYGVNHTSPPFSKEEFMNALSKLKEKKIARIE